MLTTRLECYDSICYENNLLIFKNLKTNIQPLIGQNNLVTIFTTHILCLKAQE
jgi:hypothetical protein